MENSLLGQATMDEAYARIKELEEENKRVKERADDKQAELRKEIKHLNEMIYKLEEENKKLEQERDMHRDAAKDCCYDIRDLEEENRNLKEELEKLKAQN